METRELLKKVRKLEITTAKMVNEVMAGEYHSVFKGRGMEFSEVREYVPGDDVRTIDWNVTARMGHPFIKTYTEERELTVMLLVDVSASGQFGTAGQVKAEVAAEVAALIGFSAMQNNDRVGLILFTDRVEKYVPPKKGRKHVLRVIRELLGYEPTDPQTDITAALEYLTQVQKKKAVVFLVSDFIATGFESALKIAGRRHDVIAVTVTDPREVSLPHVGLLVLEDAETGEEIVVDTGDPAMQQVFGQGGAAERGAREKLMRSIDMDHIDLFTGQPYGPQLVKFFRRRAARLRR